MYPGDLKKCGQSGRDKGSRDKILSNRGIKVEGASGYGKRRRDNRTNHGECMLKSQNDGEKDGNLIVEAIERCLIVLVFPVQGPDIGCDEIDVILRY